ncbi:MAG: pyridoxal phosphate-dependent aminotransferase [Halobacteriales archaeon]|nr:pyridoxal phosphate-dependent aminotransferase [Halobacteriales archaeon]
MRFADRVTRVEPSATVAIGNKAAELKADGVDVVDLSVGEPDFDTPEHIVTAGQEAMGSGRTTYTASSGIPALREAISETFAETGLEYGTDEIIVTPGAKQALFEVVMAMIDDGDEVVLFDPAWVSYEAMVRMAGGTPVRVDLADHGFSLEPAIDDFAAAVSDDTELVVLNSPSNPSGAVFADAALEAVRDLAVEHDFTVVSDEIYRRISYGVDPTSIGSLDGMGDRTITINGFSKAYAMTGWRLGYVGAPKPLIEQAGKLHSHSVTCAPNFVQHAGVEALTNTDPSIIQDMVDAFEDRRDLLVELFGDHGVDIEPPDGAFYMMVPVDDDDQAWCERAIEEAHVAMVPGGAFGTPGYARLSYAAATDRLREGVKRLAEAELL